MSHYAQRFAPWFVPRSMALVVALAAAFFVVLGGVAHAQIRPAERPDFKVTVASFDGVNLHVEYINATGVGYPARRYEVGFRWYASSGEPAGIRHWLPVPEVERGGISILDNRYRTELSYRSGRSVYGRRLAKFIEERPGNATELRITVDDGDRIAEVDEQNNTAVLTVAPLAVEPKPVVKLLPDLAITAFSLGEEASGDMLRIRFKNLGGSTALTRSGDSLIPFWLTWTNVDGQPVAGASSYWFDLRREPLLAGMEGVTTLTPGLGAILVPHGAGREAGRTITQFFADPPAGATHLRAIIDGPNRIEESNETNNTAIIERPALDLVIEKIAHPTTDALTIRYRNRGAINALDRSGRGVTSFWLTWTNVDGKAVVGATRYWVDHRSNTLLRPGEERILTLTSALGAVIVPHGSDLKSGRTLAQFLAAAPESATHLQVVIDGPDTYAESNEQNNVALFPKPMQPKADLRIAEFMIDPVAPRAGERVWFTVRVENVGDTTTGTPTATGLILDNDVASKKLIGQFTTETIPSGKSATLQWKKENYYGWVAVEGTHTIDACADRAEVVAEMDETNNCTRKEVRVSAPLPPPPPKLPDLVLRDATLSREKLKVTIVNVGKGTAERVMWQFRWLGTGNVALATSELEAAVGKLEAGASYPVEFPIANARAFGIFRFLQDMPDGAVALEIAVDPKNAIVESDEQNNSARIELAGPDLALGTVDARDGALSIGVKNLGTRDAKATDVWLMWFGAKGALPSSGAVDLPAIAAGKDVSVTISLDGKTEASRILRDPPKDGTKLRVFLDGSRRVEELNEQNNDRMIDRTKLPTPTAPIVTKLPDLVVRDLVITPERPQWNTVVSFTVRVENVGEASVGRSTATWLNLIRPRDGAMAIPVAEQPTTPDLAPGASAVARWEGEKYWTIQNGEHEAIICAESMGYVHESNEQNNCARKKFTVAFPVPVKPAKPDLVVQGVAFTPTDPEPGDVLTVTAVIRNAGTVAAPASVAWFTPNAESEGDDASAIPTPQDVPALAPGASTTVTWEEAWAAETGAETFEVCADVEETIAESNEENNCKTVRMIVSAQSLLRRVAGFPLRVVLDVFSTPIRAGTE